MPKEGKIGVVTGTRPEIIKMAPIIRELHKKKFDYFFVHCGQHYDYNMSQKFIEDLELASPDYNFKISEGSPGNQMAQIIIQMDGLLKKEQPSIVLVEGDTNTVLASSLASNKLNIKLGHVEAGLRSCDLRMPEEYNRRLTDHLSNYLFAPTERAKSNLIKENITHNIFITGNTVIDAINQHVPLAENKSIICEKIKFKRFAIATAHRAENVDNIEVLKNFIEAFSKAPIPIVYPIHPRTRKRLQQNNLLDKVENEKNIQLLPPLGYLDFLILMKNSELILTDSGGIQEEATAPAIKKPVLVLRLSTERQEAVEAGFATLVGINKQEILKGIESALNKKMVLPQTSPFGSGDAAKRTIEVLETKVLS